MTNEEKDKIRKKEEQRLKKIFKEYSTKAITEFTEGLIQSSAFMLASLKELEKSLQEDGFVLVSPNGAVKQNPTATAYSNLIRNYQSGIKLLCQQLPKVAKELVKEETKNELEMFMAG